MLQGAATDGMQIDDPVAGSMWRPFSLSLLILPFAILQLTEAEDPGTAFFGGSGRRENCSGFARVLRETHHKIGVYINGHPQVQDRRRRRGAVHGEDARGRLDGTGLQVRCSACSKSGRWAYDIAYDDGDFEDHVPEKFVRFPGEASGRPSGRSSVAEDPIVPEEEEAPPAEEPSAALPKMSDDEIRDLLAAVAAARAGKVDAESYVHGWKLVYRMRDKQNAFGGAPAGDIKVTDPRDGQVLRSETAIRRKLGLLEAAEFGAAVGRGAGGRGGGRGAGGSGRPSRPPGTGKNQLAAQQQQAMVTSSPTQAAGEREGGRRWEAAAARMEAALGSSCTSRCS